MIQRTNTTLLILILAALVWIGIRSRSREATAANSTARGIEVGEMRLVDSKGIERALLGLSEEGTVSLRFCDKKGKAHALLSVRSEGDAALSLIGNEGKLQIQLSLVGSSPILRLYSHHGDGEDFAGRERIALAVPADGGATLLMRENNGRPRAVLGVTGSGTSAGLILFHADGGVWTAPPIKGSIDNPASHMLSRETVLEMLKSSGLDVP